MKWEQEIQTSAREMRRWARTAANESGAGAGHTGTPVSPVAGHAPARVMCDQEAREIEGRRTICEREAVLRQVELLRLPRVTPGPHRSRLEPRDGHETHVTASTWGVRRPGSHASSTHASPVTLDRVF